MFRIIAVFVRLLHVECDRWHGIVQKNSLQFEVEELF
jgi:hypothetical protein